MSSELTPQILGLIQDGNLPLEIARKVLNCEKDLCNPNERFESEQESFPDEVVVISQALAYRRPTVTDVKSMFNFLNWCYMSEVEGSESFRSGDFMSLASIESSIVNETLSWLIVEVPEGRMTEDDGCMIALCSYTADGVSRKNGQQISLRKSSSIFFRNIYLL